MRRLTTTELRALSCSWRAGSGSAMTSRYHSRAATAASSSSPLRSRSQTARSKPLLVANATYTVLRATPASAATASIVVAG